MFYILGKRLYFVDYFFFFNFSKAYSVEDFLSKELFDLEVVKDL
jgi:hypothetical protein